MYVDVRVVFIDEMIRDDIDVKDVSLFFKVAYSVIACTVTYGDFHCIATTDTLLQHHTTVLQSRHAQ